MSHWCACFQAFQPDPKLCDTNNCLPPSVGCLRCGCSVRFRGGGYRCTCGWAAPLQQSGLDEFHPESTMNPEEPK